MKEINSYAQARIDNMQDRLDDVQRDCERWRTAYQSLLAILVSVSGPDPDIERLDHEIKRWIIG